MSCSAWGLQTCTNCPATLMFLNLKPGTPLLPANVAGSATNLAWLPLPTALKQALHHNATTAAPLQDLSAAATNATNATARRLPQPAQQLLQHPAAAVQDAAKAAQQQLSDAVQDVKAPVESGSHTHKWFRFGPFQHKAGDSKRADDSNQPSSPHVQTAAEALLSDIEAAAAAVRAAASKPGAAAATSAKQEAAAMHEHLQQLQDLLQQEEQLQQLQEQLQGLVSHKLHAARSLQAQAWAALSQVTDALEGQQQQQPHKHLLHNFLHRHHTEPDAELLASNTAARDSLLSSVAAALQLLQHSISQQTTTAAQGIGASLGADTPWRSGAGVTGRPDTAGAHAAEAVKSAAHAVTESAAAVRSAAAESVGAGKAAVQGAATAVAVAEQAAAGAVKGAAGKVRDVAEGTAGAVKGAVTGVCDAATDAACAAAQAAAGTAGAAVSAVVDTAEAVVDTAKDAADAAARTAQHAVAKTVSGWCPGSCRCCCWCS